MWKSILDAVVAAFAASDPNVYLYWRYVRLEAEDEAARRDEPTPTTGGSRRLEAVGSRREATA